MDGVLKRLVELPGPRSEPNPVEVAGMHALYLLSLLLLASGVLATFWGRGRFGCHTVLAAALLGAVSWAYLQWLASGRNPPVEVWFASHGVWLGKTFLVLLAAAGATVLCVLVGALFALALPPVAYLIYAAFIVPALAGLWCAGRLLWGYWALLRRRKVGFVPWPEPATVR